MAPKQQIHDFIRLAATQHISAGSLEEHIATVDGQKIIHAFAVVHTYVLRGNFFWLTSDR